MLLQLLLNLRTAIELHFSKVTEVCSSSKPSHLYCVCVLSHIWLFEIPWTVADQSPLFMEFSRQEYWSRLPFPSPEDLSNLGIKPVSIRIGKWILYHCATVNLLSVIEVKREERKIIKLNSVQILTFYPGSNYTLSWFFYFIYLSMTLNKVWVMSLYLK